MTSHTALVTDSTCNLPPDLAAEQRIHIAPLYVIWGENSYKDGVDITDVELLERLAASDSKDDLPKTSQVSVQDFVELFETVREAEGADEVVCAVISSFLSGTYASAVRASELVDFPVHVVDTLQASWALGFAVLAGAEARDNGAGAAAIVQAIEEAAQASRLIFTIDTLEYLHRGGRIGKASHLVGTALNIKPILELRDGEIVSVEKVRTRKRAIDHLLRVGAQHAAGRAIRRLAVIHGNVQADADALLPRAIEQFKPQEHFISNITAVLGVHVGPGAIGINIEWKS